MTETKRDRKREKKKKLAEKESGLEQLREHVHVGKLIQLIFLFIHSFIIIILSII